MGIERINLSDGAWWDIRDTVTRGMRKQFRAAGLKGLTGGLNGGSSTIDMTDVEAVKRLVMAHPESWDLNSIDDAYLIYGTVAWSFPAPITVESIDSLDEKQVEKVLARMKELYAELSEEIAKK